MISIICNSLNALITGNDIKSLVIALIVVNLIVYLISNIIIEIRKVRYYL